MLIMFEILIYSFRKTLLISKYLSVIMCIWKRSYSLVIIEWSCFSIFCSYSLYSDMISFVYSSYFSDGQISDFFFSRKYHLEFFSSNFNFLKIREYFWFFFHWCLFGMRLWLTREWKEKLSQWFYLFKREMWSDKYLFSKLWRSKCIIEIHDVSNRIPMHWEREGNVSYFFLGIYFLLNDLNASNEYISFFVICFVTHRCFDYNVHSVVRVIEYFAISILPRF